MEAAQGLRLNRLPPLGVIAGPTASGKTALALATAAALEALGRPVIIINADSAQVYADLHVLSARPVSAETALVPHRLFGHVAATETYNAARWSEDARKAIKEAHARGAVPILVGGTGLYLRTLLDGIAPIPDIPAPVRAAVRTLPVEAAYAALSMSDPIMAGRLRPTDTTRVARALEVMRATGRSIADWQSQTQGGIAPQVTIAARLLLPPRDWLFERCASRFDRMMMDGALDEVAALVARRTDPTLPVMRAIGVPELAAYIGGTSSRDDAISAAVLATRRYAKRQYTWFRNQPPEDWPRVGDAIDAASIESVAQSLADALNG